MEKDTVFLLGIFLCIQNWPNFGFSSMSQGDKNIMCYILFLIFFFFFSFLCLLFSFQKCQRALPSFSPPAGPLLPRSPAGLSSEAVRRGAPQPSIKIEGPRHPAFPCC